jgi:hypothetical protein
MVIVAAIGLAAVGALRPWWTPAVLVAIAGSYLYLRYDFLRTHGDTILSFHPFKNVQGDSPPNEGVLGRVFTGYDARGLSLVIWVLALVGVVRLKRAGAGAAVLLGLMIAPFTIAFGVEYGGETIYRVYFFSLPWAALLASFALVPRSAWSALAALRVGLVLTLLTAMFLQAYFGLEEINRIRPGEVAASVYFNNHAQPRSVLVLAAPDFPERSTGAYARYVVTSGAFDPQLITSKEFGHRMLGPADVPAIADMVTAYKPKDGRGYLAISTGMKIYAHVFKLAPDGTLDSLDRALAHSPRWRVFYRNSDAVIYELLPPT